MKAKKEFYQHLMAFVIVNTFIFLVNLLTTPLNWWFLYPLLGWSMGLAFHYVEVFGIPGFNILTKEWEEEELNKELHRMQYDESNEKRQLIEPKRMGIDEELKLKVLRKNYDESDLV